MGSSFLSTIHLILSIYCLVQFLKLVVQFGLPNHPSRLLIYLLSACTGVYFTLNVMADFNCVPPLTYLRWKSIPMVAGGIGILLQAVGMVGALGHIQQKVISRIPVLGALISFGFFPDYAHFILVACIVVTAIYLSFLVGKARYQKRMFYKMTIFLFLMWVMKISEYFVIYVFAELLLFPALFYFFIIQQSCGVSSLIDDFENKSEALA